ncbi:MAG: hypothetical protein SFX73_19755 [Kofleriaceae bacterium]|nr:hypothetical protein [Kofleriaceae bacterium]
MMFELAWRGGATETRLHRRRPGIEDIPWGTLALDAYPATHALEARRVWSNGVFTEYASAAAFSALTTALLECGAPVDLIAASADIAVDELFHVELSSRLTMELGGAVPIAFDLANIAPITAPGLRPLARAAEIAVVTSCVSESLSVPAMARSRALAADPLVHVVLSRLLADEGPHARLGFWFLDWAAEQLTDEERAHLARVAVDSVAVYAPLWQEEPCDTCPLPSGLGGHDAVGRAKLRRAVDIAIATPLARYGIELDRQRLASLTTGPRVSPTLTR